MSATQTTNLGLNKPDRQDYVSVVSDINENMDRIDSSVGNIITPVFSPSTAYSVGDYVIYNRELYRFTTAHQAGSWNSSHVAKTNLAQESNSLKSAINSHTNIKDYFYKANTYMKDGVETSLSGYDLYKIPVSSNDVVFIGSVGNSAFWESLNQNYAVSVKKSDDSFARVNSATADWIFNATEKAALIIVPTDVVEIYVCVYSQNSASFSINETYDEFTHDSGKTGDIPYIITEKNAIKSHFYMRYGNDLFDVLADQTYILKIRAGDRLVFSGLETGYDHYGVFKASGDTDVIKISTATYIAQNDGVVCIYSKTGTDNYTIHITTGAYNASGINITSGGKKIVLVAGVIRNTGNGWEYINNSGHNPMNLATVSVNESGQIVIGYGFTAKKVLSLIVAPDETFANKYTFGGSVGLSDTLVNVCTLPKEIGGMVTYNTTTEQWNIANSDFTAASFNTTTGILTLSHEDLSDIPSVNKFYCSVSGRGCIAVMGDVADDYMNVMFLDNNGVSIKSPGSSTRLYALRHINSYKVDASDVVSNTGNIWIFGVMEV